MIVEITSNTRHAFRPHQVLIDISTESGWLKMDSGTSWPAWAMPQRWPFCWWLAPVVDGFSRRVVGFGVFDAPPTSVAIRGLLARAARAVGRTPRHLVCDRGRQFDGFRR